MRKLIYSGLITCGLAGLIGCEKEAGDIKRESIIKNIPYGDIPVAKYWMGSTHAPVSTAVGDMNGDGRNDIIISSCGRTYVFLNNDDGSYSSQSPPVRAEAEKR